MKDTHFAEDSETVRKHIFNMGKWIRERDVEALARHCAIPFIAYVQDEILVIDNWSDLKQMYRKHCEALHADGPFDAEMTVLSHIASGGGRHSIRVKWRLHYPATNKTLDLATGYMLRIDDDGKEVVLELLEDLTAGNVELSVKAINDYAGLTRK